MCKKMTMMFPDDSGIEVEVEYEIDKELYPQNNGVFVENVLLTGSKKPYWFTEFLNDAAFDLITKMINQKFEDMKNARFAVLAEERYS